MCDIDITYGHNICTIKTILGTKQFTNYDLLKNGKGQISFSCRKLPDLWNTSYETQNINNMLLLLPNNKSLNYNCDPNTLCSNISKNNNTVIVGIEISTGDNGIINKLTGIYYCDIADVYTNNSLKCYTDTKITNFYANVIPEYYVDYFDFPLGIDINENLNNRILIKAPLGYAISGMEFNTTGDRVVSQLIVKFSSVFDRTAIDKYALYDYYYRTVKYDNKKPIISGNTSFLYCDKGEFFQQLNCLFVPQTEQQFSMLEKILGNIVANLQDNIKNGKVCNMTSPSFINHGFKGFLEARTIRLDPEVFVWINDIDKMRMCDITGKDLYDKDTIEYLYSRYVLNLVIDQDGFTYKLPVDSSCNNILDGFCTTDKLHDDKCEMFCGLNHTDCDSKIFQYCNDPKFWTQIQLKFETENEGTVNVKNIPNNYADSVCSCIMDYNTQEYMDKIKGFYTKILPRYQEELKGDPKNLVLQNKVAYIQNKIDTVGLYNISSSLKDSLKFRMKPDEYKQVQDIKLPCTFSWCKESNFKLKSQKNIKCNPTEECLGNGITVPMVSSDGSRVNCNFKEGVSNYISCTSPTDPQYVAYPDFKSSYCRNIMNKDYQGSSETITSYCKLSTEYNDKECNYQDRDIDGIFCKAGNMIKEASVIIPESPLHGEGLCPPPNKFKTLCQYRNECTKSPSSSNNYVIFITALIFILSFYLFYKYKWQRF